MFCFCNRIKNEEGETLKRDKMRRDFSVINHADKKCSFFIALEHMVERERLKFKND